MRHNGCGPLLLAAVIILAPAPASGSERALSPSPLQGACDVLLSAEVEGAFRNWAEAAGSRETGQQRAVDIEPLTAALRNAASELEDRDLVLVADLRQCQISGSTRVCPGSLNLLNTGLDNHEPDDTARDLLRWHGVSGFIGNSLVHPEGAPDESRSHRRSRLRCWAIVP